MRNFLRVVSGASLVFGMTAAAWAQPAGTYVFDVASIKAAPPPSGNMIRMGSSGGLGSTSPGQITVQNMALRDLVQKAYGIKPYQLTAPDWMTTARFNIV